MINNKTQYDSGCSLAVEINQLYIKKTMQQQIIRERKGKHSLNIERFTSHGEYE